MRKTWIAAGLTLALATSCSQKVAPDDPMPSSRYTFWRPAPVEGAPDPAEIIKNSAESDWRAVDPDNLLILDLAGGARVAVELATDFAPVHVANVKAFARGGTWEKATVYRVQDNYVVQWGNNEAEAPILASVVKLPPAEYHRPLTGLDIRPLGFPDSYAPIVGHAGGWPVAYDPESGRAWLPHCYAMVGVARDLAPDTGSGVELYAVMGHAPRHLDRNIALVGRVIDGFPNMTALRRGTAALGFIEDVKQQTPIARIRLASDIALGERPVYEVMRTDTTTFSNWVTGAANRGGDFFDVAAGGVDICNARVPTRLKPS